MIEDINEIAIDAQPAPLTLSIHFAEQNEFRRDGWQRTDPEITLDKLFGLGSSWFDSKIAISNILWRDGIRRTENFERVAGCIILDHDDGVMTLEHARAFYNQFDAILYTSKSNQKRKASHEPCDRFRAIISTDRHIEEPEENTLVIKTLAALLPIDPSTCDAARLYNMGCVDGGLHYRCQGRLVLCIDKILAMAQQLNIRVSGRVTPHELSARSGAGIRNGNLVNQINSWIRTFEHDPSWQSRDSYSKVFSLLLVAFDKCPRREDIEESFRSMPWIQEWFSRHPQQESSFSSLVDKTCRIWKENILKDKYVELEPPTPIEVINTEELPALDPGHQAVVDQYHQSHGISDTTEGLATHKLLAHLLQHSHRSILDVPCGGEKSTAAICAAVTFACPRRQFMIVKETVSACLECKHTLESIGKNVGILAGYKKRYCRKDYPEEQWRIMYSNSRSPCRECEHAIQCLFGRTYHKEYRKEELSKEVVLVTHARFINMWISKKIPPNAYLIIDEALERFERFDLNQQDLAGLRQALGDEAGASLTTTLLQIVIHHPNSCVFFSPTVSDLVELRKSIHAQLDDGDSLDQRIGEKALEYINYFNTGLCFTMRTQYHENTTFSWIKDRFLCDLPNRMVILDGSAQYSNTAWKDFTIFRSSEHRQQRYQNVTIHFMGRHPTKSSLLAKRPPFISAIEVFLHTHPDAKPFIVTNKLGNDPELEPIQTYTNNLTSRGAIHLQRGFVIGSNEARECNVAILMMSTFTNLADYVLQAALVDNTEINESRIYTCEAGQVKRPRMRGEGFEDPSIDREYRRSYINELYQTIMRGIIRQHPEEEYHVFCFLDSWGMLVELEKLLPGFKLQAIEETAHSEGMMGYMTVRDECPENLSYRSLARILRKSRGGAEKLQTLREYRALLL